MSYEISYCTGCNARILWAWSPRGKRMPLDVDPRPDGIFAFIPGTNRVRFVRPEDRPGCSELYIAHHITCPKSALYRSAKPSSHHRARRRTKLRPGPGGRPIQEESR